MFLLEGEAELELFVAVVHKVLEYDRGGDYQRADDERRYVVEEEIADSKEEHRNDDSERIGLYNDYQAEYGGYDGHSENHEAVRNEREQDAVGGGDSLSAFEFKYGRKRVAEHGRRYNERKEHMPVIGDIHFCEEHRNEALCDVEHKAEYAELDADAAHDVSHSGVVVVALLDYVNSAEQLRNKVAVHDTSRNITCNNK